MTKDLNRDLRRVMKTGKSLLHLYEGGQGGSHGRFRIREGPLFLFSLAVSKGRYVRAYAKFPVQGTIVHDAFVLLAYSYMNLCKSHKRQGEDGELIVSYRSEGGLPGRLQ